MISPRELLANAYADSAKPLSDKYNPGEVGDPVQRQANALWYGYYNGIMAAGNASGDPGGKTSQFLAYCVAAFNSRQMCEQVSRSYKVLASKPLYARKDPTQLLADASSGLAAARQITTNSLNAALAMLASNEIESACYLAVVPDDPGKRITADDQAQIANSKQDIMFLLQSGVNKQQIAENTLRAFIAQVDRFGIFALLVQMDAILASLSISKLALCKIYASAFPGQGQPTNSFGQSLTVQPLLDLLQTSIFADLIAWSQRVVDLAVQEAQSSLTFTSPPLGGPRGTEAYTGRNQLDNNRIGR